MSEDEEEDLGRGEPKLFSASQASCFELCERQWGWIYLEHLRKKQHPSAALGTAIHTYLEDSLSQGFWNLLDPMHTYIEPAKKLLEKVPASADIERYFRTELGGHRWRGKIDLSWVGESWGNGLPVIFDHKSTKNFKWVKEPEDLLRDVQATLYTAVAWWIFYEGEPGPVDLHWQYYRTKGAPATKPIRLRVYPEDVQPRLEKTYRTAERMSAAIDAGLRAGDMKPNWDSCSAYGGCPFRAHCAAEEEAKGTGIEVDARKAALLAQLRGAAAGAKPAETPNPAPPTEAHGPPINPPDEPAPPPAKAPEPEPAAPPAPAAAAPPPSPVEEPEPEQPAAEPKAKGGKGSRKKVTLYVNCLPTSGAKMPAHASTLFEKARTKIPLAHYALEEFGKGRGRFAAALREVIDAEGGLPDALYLWTGTSEGRDAFEVLASYSDVIVQGVPG